jgi:pimeloyl-ACP methyl ester carboxylesterase
LSDPNSISFPIVEGVSHRFVDAGGLRTHVAEAGPEDGEPIVLLHGWPQHWYEWRGLVPRLSERHRLVMPDLRGLGWTEIARNGYEKEQLASDVIALLDAMGLDRVKLVGHDWGGYVGFLLALRAPERVERFLALNIIHPWPARSLRNTLNSWRLAYQLPLVAPLLGPRVTRIPGVVGLYLRGGVLGGHQFTDEEIEAFEAPLRDPERAKVTARYYRAFQLRDFPALASGRYRGMRLHVPTLLMFGTGDAAIAKSNLAGFEPYADDMRVELVDGSGHFIADTFPELVAERALEFFGAR